MKIYLIGSLRNPVIPEIGVRLREHGFEVFDDWFGGGPEADDCWQRYEQVRGRGYAEALYGEAAQTIFNFDKRHLDSSDAAVLVLPAGKSGHLELGYMAGQGKLTYVLFDEVPARWDVMYQFVNKVFFDVDDLLNALGKEQRHGRKRNRQQQGRRRSWRELFAAANRLAWPRRPQ